ncbi:hypothetical protein [Roseiconus lacunae]|uniref:Secreted protein n=1 Tax=Roseiconus lacunae TaxID=2605694 RepID=A0ABT7PH94_9BACT|nr:hypothetical protein [Roseiconus lacunae]MCD0458194.1 hypothetical protein [Roseiconus lacunae]MDM4015713.1 hypothetical protein [Roseiconus lacunae]WRQ52308.1 hypothetical protein U8335_07115 [Stieleria sp. HD01]
MVAPKYVALPLFVLLFVFVGCGSEGGFEESEPQTQEELEYAENYEKMLNEQQKENYGN